MEITPILNDSGLGSDCSSSGVKRNLHFMYNECTPRGFTRKRKAFGRNCSDDTFSRKLSDVLEASEEIRTSNISYEVSFMASNFKRSSPISAELSWSLQKCTLDAIERREQPSKKFKWDDEVFDCSRKSNSEPGTPHRDVDHQPSVTKCRSIELTPVKSQQQSVQQKIGTPERNEILYPQLKEVKPLTKPKSAQRLRDDLKRPATQHRKRLFICRDFVYLFSKVQDHRAIIRKIFAYLDESDLAHVARVSPLWRKVLRCDSAAYERLRQHARVLSATKENPPRCVKYKAASPVRTWSPPGSPTSENWRKYVKLGLQINPNQSLIKCFVCLRPAVLEQNIAQCSCTHCSYIWCIKCQSGTKLGPTHLHCKCTDLKHTMSPSKDRCGLSDISNADSTSFSFFNNSPSDNTSSGYFSLSDFDKSNSYYKPVQLRHHHHQQQQQQTPVSKRKHTVLTDCNKNYIASPSTVSSTAPRKGDSFHMVYRQCRDQTTYKREPIEPDSPPQIKLKVGSKKSKKNLRRCCFDSFHPSIHPIPVPYIAYIVHTLKKIKAIQDGKCRNILFM